MGDAAFWKGGFGCLLVFAGFAIIALLLGGRVHIDFFGAIFLFIIGGIIGLVTSYIYNKGRKDAAATAQPPKKE